MAKLTKIANLGKNKPHWPNPRFASKSLANINGSIHIKPPEIESFCKKGGKKKHFYVTATCSSRGNGTNDFRKWTHLPLPYHSSLSQSPCLMMHHCGSLVVTLATSIVIATTPDRQLSGGFPPPPFLLTIFMNHDPHHNGINKWMKSTSVDG